MGKTFLTAEWRRLAMANYVVPESLLMPYLPHGTELDRYQGRCYVSLIGFMFQEVRLKGFRIPFHSEFEEVNLRFYVRRTGEDGANRRGAVFLSELVPRGAITLVANTLYGEKYATVAMRHKWRSAPGELSGGGGSGDEGSGGEASGGELSVRYEWRQKGRWFGLGVEASAAAQAIGVGSEEEFITEHYWGYTKLRSGRTSEYEVAHPRWEVYPVKRFTIDVDFGVVYGNEFAWLNAEQPGSVLLAEGSEVAVLGGRRL